MLSFFRATWLIAGLMGFFIHLVAAVVQFWGFCRRREERAGGHKEKGGWGLLPSSQLGGKEDPETTATPLPVQTKTARCSYKIPQEPRVGNLDELRVASTLMMLS